jgi:transposase
MTTSTLPSGPRAVTEAFATPATAERIDRAASALTARGFIVEIVADVAAARARIVELLPRDAAVFTAASETLRLGGIDDDINASGRYAAVKPRIHALDRTTQAADIRRLTATPDVVVGSVSAVTEDGALVAVSASGSQLSAYAGGAARMIWVIGAQKIVADLDAAFRRIESYALPLEDARARTIYGRSSAINKVLIVNAEPVPGRATVLLVRQAIGF